MIMVMRNRRERHELAEWAVGMAKVPGPEKLDVKDIRKTLIKREKPKHLWKGYKKNGHSTKSWETVCQNYLFKTQNHKRLMW